MLRALCRSTSICFLYLILCVMLLFALHFYMQNVESMIFRFDAFTSQQAKAPAIVARKKLQHSFRDSWLRLHKARVDWRAILAPCTGITDWGSTKPGWERKIRSSGSNSYIYYMDIRAAGEFTRIFIHSQTKNGENKTVGGDSWRVYFKGPSVVAATVFDHENGTYEAMALFLDPGKYVMEAILDYSLCDGLKDPPESWFRDGNRDGSYQPDGILGFLDEYLVEPLQGGKIIKIHIPLSDKVLSRINDSVACGTICNALWDGYGRWINDSWIPYIPEISIEAKRQTITFPKERKGTLWVYGDSLAVRFHSSLSSKPLCRNIFSSCRYSYNWVYPIINRDERGAIRQNDDFDFRPNLVLESIRDVLRHKEMKSVDSLLVLNVGIHYPIRLNFTIYQNLITEVIRMLEYREKELGSKAEVIWKTMTAIHKEIYKKPRNITYSRFFTDQRVRLFDAYAMSAMCKAGINILDIYHLTASSKKGILDACHYANNVFRKAEMEIQSYWTTGRKFRPRQVCIGE